MNKELLDIPNSLIIKVIDEWVKGDRNRAIMRDRYIDLMPYEAIAETYSLSVSTVVRTISKYSPVMFKQLDKTVSQSEKTIVSCNFMSLKMA